MKKTLLAIAAALVMIPTIATANPDRLEILSIEGYSNSKDEIQAAYLNDSDKRIDFLNIECKVFTTAGDHVDVVKFVAINIPAGNEKYWSLLIDSSSGDIDYECYENELRYKGDPIF